jgi:hypothetical protein
MFLFISVSMSAFLASMFGKVRRITRQIKAKDIIGYVKAATAPVSVFTMNNPNETYAHNREISRRKY